MAREGSSSIERYPTATDGKLGWVNGVDFSDHLNFWKHGFPALMVTDTALFRNRAYHKLSDTPERLDYARMTRLTEGLVELIAELAGSPASL